MIAGSTKNTMGVPKTLPSTDTVVAALSPPIQKRDSRHALTDFTIYRSALKKLVYMRCGLVSMVYL